MESCIFCKIVQGKLPSKKAYEDDEYLAFYDIQPVAKTHLIFIPKKHVRSLLDSEASSNLVGGLIEKLRSYARGSQLDGYRLVINTEASGGQTVFHLHAHLIAGPGISNHI